jgi:DNA primase
LSDNWEPKKKASLFGGIYQNIGRNAKPELKTYDESVLKQYPKCGSLRFLKDHINLKSQMKFGLMYSIESQRILIPIRDVFGSLVGLKARRNYETDNEEDPKYLYELPCQKSMLLYGAHENYQHLMNADRIIIGESEKFVLACDSYNYNSAVSIMGSMLSAEQAKILLGFNAKEYCFMLDEGLDPQVTYNNAKLLKSFAAMRECKITYFDYRDSLSVGEKESPTDGGRENFYYILENEIKELQTEEEDEI